MKQKCPKYEIVCFFLFSLLLMMILVYILFEGAALFKRETNRYHNLSLFFVLVNLIRSIEQVFLLVIVSFNNKKPMLQNRLLK